MTHFVYIILLGSFQVCCQPKTKTLVSKHERILIELYSQNVSLLFNQTCLNEARYFVKRRNGKKNVCKWMRKF